MTLQGLLLVALVHAVWFLVVVLARCTVGDHHGCHLSVVEACMDDFHLQLSNMNERVSFLLGTIIRGILI